MIKTAMERKTGGYVLLLGLSQANLDKLPLDKPIPVDLDVVSGQLGIARTEIREVTIFAGPAGATEQDLFEIIKAAHHAVASGSDEGPRFA